MKLLAAILVIASIMMGLAIIMGAVLGKDPLFGLVGAAIITVAGSKLID